MDRIDLVPEADEGLTDLLSYPLHTTLNSEEAKPLLDSLSEFSASFMAAYENGKLLAALEEGHAGWKNWVKSFGKSLKRKGKSLFMPLRLLLTGKLHGPDIGASVLLLHKAGKCGVVTPEAGFVPLEGRFTILKQIDWDALSKDSKDQPLVETAATVSN